ncbi:MAG: hypothetical protein A4S09_15185 [Proteobacteria bacterium SG_bin7]|nr:MAG: hypothetical protein A4S09_15185 [Proteobacteria bacterium SG_bin7]
MQKKGASHISQTERLTKIEGQVRGVIKMVEEERYCMDILTQLRSMQSALRSVEREIARAHVESCVKKAIDAGNSKELKEHLQEISEFLSQLYRT